MMPKLGSERPFTKGAGRSSTGYSTHRIPPDPNQQAWVIDAIKAFEYLKKKHKTDERIHLEDVRAAVKDGVLLTDQKSIRNSMHQAIQLAVEGALHTVLIKPMTDTGYLADGQMLAITFVQNDALLARVDGYAVTIDDQKKIGPSFFKK